MLDIEPPKVPLNAANIDNSRQGNPATTTQSTEKKEGFFKRLFSKKEQPQDTQQTKDMKLPDMPAFDSQLDMEAFPGNTINDSKLESIEQSLPQMPVMDIKGKQSNVLLDFNNPQVMQPVEDKNTKKDVKKGKAKGKRTKERPFSESYERVNLQERFDWTDSIGNQENVIYDSNRNNEDINALLARATQQVEQQIALTKENSLQTSHEEVQPKLPDVGTIPITMDDLAARFAPQKDEPMTMAPELSTASTDIHKQFESLAKSQQRIRSQIYKKIKSPKFNLSKKEILELLKSYDELIEDKIEQKELSVGRKSTDLAKLEKILKDKEMQLKSMHAHISDLSKKLHEKELKLNETISSTVARQLAKRLAKEKAMLKKELTDTIRLNKELKRKLDIIEKDRKNFDTTSKKIMDEEREKLNHMQSVYEKKLAELDAEKKTFDEQRSNELKDIETRKAEIEKMQSEALVLVEKASQVSHDLEETKKIKQSLDTEKKAIKKNISIDKKLKEAIRQAENHLQEEKEDTEKMVFSRYIESKLKEIKPKAAENTQLDNDSRQIHSLIDTCRDNLLAGNIDEAKKNYALIKELYEKSRMDYKEKEILYNIVKELYNEIQLTIIEKQLA